MLCALRSECLYYSKSLVRAMSSIYIAKYRDRNLSTGRVMRIAQRAPLLLKGTVKRENANLKKGAKFADERRY